MRRQTNYHVTVECVRREATNVLHAAATAAGAAVLQVVAMCRLCVQCAIQEMTTATALAAAKVNLRTPGEATEQQPDTLTLPA